MVSDVKVKKFSWEFSFQNLFLFFFAGHGNHKENSPFLNSSEASKGGDYYDKNLALFEVISDCFSQFWCDLWSSKLAGAEHVIYHSVECGALQRFRCFGT